MADNSNIEWCDATWNPVRGCSKVSEGCRNCYAMGVAARFSGRGLPYEGLAERRGGAAQWTNRIMLVDAALTLPLRWKKPRRVFVNSMSDLFHPDVPQEFVYRVSLTMLRAHWHTYQVLTKRPERMADVWLTSLHCQWLREALRNHLLTDANIRHMMRHVWLGTSVEDQPTADARLPQLLRLPAAVLFVSYEPALAAVDFAAAGAFGEFIPPGNSSIGGRYSGAHVHWIIVGGESGPDARPFDLAWAYDAVKQCRDLGVACFVKQMGAAPYFRERPFCFKDKKGGDMTEWPEDLRVREFPEVER